MTKSYSKADVADLVSLLSRARPYVVNGAIEWGADGDSQMARIIRNLVKQIDEAVEAWESGS